jgi:hypothetical protein
MFILNEVLVSPARNLQDNLLFRPHVSAKNGIEICIVASLCLHKLAHCHAGDAVMEAAKPEERLQPKKNKFECNMA